MSEENSGHQPVLLARFSDNAQLLRFKFALEREEIPYQVRHEDAARKIQQKIFDYGQEESHPEIWVPASFFVQAKNAVAEEASNEFPVPESCPACGTANPFREKECPECGLFLA